MPKKAQVRFDPYTHTLDILDNLPAIQTFAADLREDVGVLCNALGSHPLK